MMKVFEFILVAACFWGALAGCKEEGQMEPVNTNDPVPEPVSNVQVESLHGGARINYTLPPSENLLYVKAVFSIREGVEREVKSSYYNNHLIIEGFPDTSEYEVKLFTVSRGEVESEPVILKITPLTPPVTQVFRTLAMNTTFGGISVNFRNEAEAKVVLTVLAADSLGDMATAERYYTERPEGAFSARGFPAEKRKFGVFVRDRWDNRSDTAYVELTPLFEEELDKAKFREVNLPTDTHEPHVGGGMVQLWDDIWGSNGNTFHTKPNTGIPQWFTFDLGVTARLSRFKFYHRPGGTDGAYYAGDPQTFEVWGSNDPADDGSWDSWELLGEFESIKPSGQGTPTAEDLAFATETGEEFEFDLDAPPVRYIRFKTTKTWGGVTYIYMSELSFWGKED